MGSESEQESIHRYFAKFPSRNRIDPTGSVGSAPMKHCMRETGLRPRINRAQGGNEIVAGARKGFDTTWIPA